MTNDVFVAPLTPADCQAEIQQLKALILACDTRLAELNREQPRNQYLRSGVADSKRHLEQVLGRYKTWLGQQRHLATAEGADVGDPNDCVELLYRLYVLVKRIGKEWEGVVTAEDQLLLDCVGHALALR